MSLYIVSLLPLVWTLPSKMFELMTIIVLHHGFIKSLFASTSSSSSKTSTTSTPFFILNILIILSYMCNLQIMFFFNMRINALFMKSMMLCNSSIVKVPISLDPWMEHNTYSNLGVMDLRIFRSPLMNRSYSWRSMRVTWIWTNCGNCCRQEW